MAGSPLSIDDTLSGNRFAKRMRENDDKLPAGARDGGAKVGRKRKQDHNKADCEDVDETAQEKRAEASVREPNKYDCRCGAKLAVGWTFCAACGTPAPSTARCAQRTDLPTVACWSFNKGLDVEFEDVLLGLGDVRVSLSSNTLLLYVISWKPFLLSGVILFLGLVVFSGALNNQEMPVTLLPAIRFGLDRYGFEYLFKPDRSSMVSGSIH